MTNGINRVEKAFAEALFPRTKRPRPYKKKKKCGPSAGEAVHRAMMQSWTRKGKILHSTYHDSVDPIAYNEALFHGQSHKRACVWTKAPKGQKTHWYDTTERMLCEVSNRTDAAVCPAEFFQTIRRTSMLKSIHALTVDLDGVSPEDLQGLIADNFMSIVPTYLVNSGFGVHLVYLFDEPVQCYNWGKKILTDILTKLKGTLSVPWYSYHVDPIPSLVQAYRVVGSRTKLGQTATAYLVGSVWSVSNLAAAVGIVWERPTPASKPICPKDHGNVVTIPSGRMSFYQAVRQGIQEKTTRGNRHMSMFALAVIGVKCRIPDEQVRHDLNHLRKFFNHRDGNDMREAEVTNVLGTLDRRKAKSVSSSTLETWLGWPFERKTKRNGRSRQEHLSILAEEKTQKSSTAVYAYLNEHPTATNADISRATGISRRTVAKYRTQHVAMTNESETRQDASSATSATELTENQKRELVGLVTAIMDPSTSPQVRQSLLQRVPSTRRKIIEGWLTG